MKKKKILFIKIYKYICIGIYFFLIVGLLLLYIYINICKYIASTKWILRDGERERERERENIDF